MNIAIGINGFKKEEDLLPRELLCLESLRKIKTDNIKLYNICYEEENIIYKDFTTLFTPNISNNKLTYVNQNINTLAQVDADIILFLNNDIIVSNKLLDIFDDSDTYPISRVHLHSLDSLDEELNMQAYSVQGFDAFAFKKDWWLENNNLFPNYFIGKPYWDTHFFVICMLNSKCKVINKLPPVIFHIEHESVACTSQDFEQAHNENIAIRHKEMGLWWKYVYDVLLKRESYNDILWYLPFENEEELERHYFTR